MILPLEHSFCFLYPQNDEFNKMELNAIKNGEIKLINIIDKENVIQRQ